MKRERQRVKKDYWKRILIPPVILWVSYSWRGRVGRECGGGEEEEGDPRREGAEVGEGDGGLQL